MAHLLPFTPVTESYTPPCVYDSVAGVNGSSDAPVVQDNAAAPSTTWCSYLLPPYNTTQHHNTTSNTCWLQPPFVPISRVNKKGKGLTFVDADDLDVSKAIAGEGNENRFSVFSEGIVSKAVGEGEGDLDVQGIVSKAVGEMLVGESCSPAPTTSSTTKKVDEEEDLRGEFPTSLSPIAAVVPFVEQESYSSVTVDIMSDAYGASRRETSQAHVASRRERVSLREASRNVSLREAVEGAPGARKEGVAVRKVAGAPQVPRPCASPPPPPPSQVLVMERRCAGPPPPRKELSAGAPVYTSRFATSEETRR